MVPPNRATTASWACVPGRKERWMHLRFLFCPDTISDPPNKTRQEVASLRPPCVVVFSAVGLGDLPDRGGILVLAERLQTRLKFLVQAQFTVRPPCNPRYGIRNIVPLLCFSLSPSQSVKLQRRTLCGRWTEALKWSDRHGRQLRSTTILEAAQRSQILPSLALLLTH